MAPILYASVLESVCLHKAIVPFVCACVWCFEHSNITLKWLNTVLCVCMCVCMYSALSLSVQTKEHSPERPCPALIYRHTKTKVSKQYRMDSFILTSARHLLHLSMSPLFRYLHGRKKEEEEKFTTKGYPQLSSVASLAKMEGLV